MEKRRFPANKLPALLLVGAAALGACGSVQSGGGEPSPSAVDWDAKKVQDNPEAFIKDQENTGVLAYCWGTAVVTMGGNIRSAPFVEDNTAIGGFGAAVNTQRVELDNPGRISVPTDKEDVSDFWYTATIANGGVAFVNEAAISLDESNLQCSDNPRGQNYLTGMSWHTGMGQLVVIK